MWNICLSFDMNLSTFNVRKEASTGQSASKMNCLSAIGIKKPPLQLARGGLFKAGQRSIS
jgi:hypothetical protein